MIEAPKTVYVTKYALTSGIKEAEVTRLDDDGYVNVLWPGGLNGREGFGRGNWAPTRVEAIAQAEKKRLAKLKSLEKQTEKLRALTFG